MNLNRMQIPCRSGLSQPLTGNDVVRDQGGAVTVHFRHLEDRLVDYVGGAELVLGCVAWLTNEAVLSALAELKFGASLVVQKEDWLRPDLGQPLRWKARLRQFYDSLKLGLDRHDFAGTVVEELSTHGDAAIGPVRCLGGFNSDRAPAFPRMHHKFAVFCRVGQHQAPAWRAGRPRPVPYAVWTGSFNFTKNAAMSLENAVVLTSPSVVSAYYREWAQILALSEPLDWEAEWCAPEWRIGT